jgi:hypothetical protein
MDDIGGLVKNEVNIINKPKNQACCFCMKRISGFMGNNHTALALKNFFQFIPGIFIAAVYFKRFNIMRGILSLTGNTVGLSRQGGKVFCDSEWTWFAVLSAIKSI